MRHFWQFSVIVRQFTDIFRQFCGTFVALCGIFPCRIMVPGGHEDCWRWGTANSSFSRFSVEIIFDPQNSTPLVRSSTPPLPNPPCPLLYSMITINYTIVVNFWVGPHPQPTPTGRGRLKNFRRYFIPNFKVVHIHICSNIINYHRTVFHKSQVLFNCYHIVSIGLLGFLFPHPTIFGNLARYLPANSIIIGI